MALKEMKSKEESIGRPESRCKCTRHGNLPHSNGYVVNYYEWLHANAKREQA